MNYEVPCVRAGETLDCLSSFLRKRWRPCISLCNFYPSSLDRALTRNLVSDFSHHLHVKVALRLSRSFSVEFSFGIIQRNEGKGTEQVNATIEGEYRRPILVCYI